MKQLLQKSAEVRNFKPDRQTGFTVRVFRFYIGVCGKKFFINFSSIVGITCIALPLRQYNLQVTLAQW
jgi:hypothetical protein